MKIKPIHILLLLILAMIWGSSFILMKWALRDEEGNAIFLPQHLGSLRMMIAGLLLLPVSLRALAKVDRSKLKWIAVVGLIGSGVPAFLFATAQSGHVESSVSGILNSLTPVFTLLVGLAIFGKRFTLKQIAGVVLGLLGAIALISIRGVGEKETEWFYASLIVLATLSYGLSVNVVQSKLQGVPSLHITSISLLIVGLPAGIYAFLSDFQSVVAVNPHGWEALGYIAVLSCFGTAVANILYFRLTLETNAMFASSVTYLMPIVAVGWGLADNEVFTWRHLLCSAIIIAGVWLINHPKASKA